MDEFEDEDDVPQIPSWPSQTPSWTTFCPDPDEEEDWPEELEGLEDEDF